MDKPSFGGTLTTGIQDISALLPLLGTEQCEDHVSSALTKGFLYAAATPMSLFGSLGMARAGFKTLIAGITYRDFNGARILANMGFKPQGTNLSLIMNDQGADGRYLVESRVDTLLKDLHIDDASKVKPSMECAKWNAKIIAATALSCVLSIIPYIYLNLNNKLGLVTRWIFPGIRAVGGFLVATMIQMIIQNRVLVIVTQSLMIRDIEETIKATEETIKGTEETRIKAIEEVRIGTTEEMRIEKIKDIKKSRKELLELSEKLVNSKKDLDLESRLRHLETSLEPFLKLYHKWCLNNLVNTGDRQAKEAGQWNESQKSGIVHSDIEKGRDMNDNAGESRFLLGRMMCEIRKLKPKRLQRESSLVEFDSLPAQSPFEGNKDPKSTTGNVTPSVQIDDSQCEKLNELKQRLDEARSIGLTRLVKIVYSIFLLAGIIASVVGYIGCFSVVQGSKSRFGPAIWLGLETFLSTIRILLWGWNPSCDDIPPFTLEFKLSSPLLLTTCNKYAEEIDEDKVLPLVRAPEFLGSLTAYAGRLERFEDPNLALYYAITRKEEDSQSALYIAIFDLAERTTRIYVQPTADEETFYNTAEPLEVDLEHAVLQIKIGGIVDPNNDPVASNANTRSSLKLHYQSILAELKSRNDHRGDVDNIRNRWTFRIEDLNPKEWNSSRNPDKAVSGGNGVSPQDELLYLCHGKLERLNRHFRVRRVEWIDAYMEIVEQDINEKFDEAKLVWQRKQEEVRKVKLGKEGNLAKETTREDEQKVMKGKSSDLKESVQMGSKQVEIEDNEMQIHAGEEVTSKPSGDVGKGADEVKELLLIAERWMMEMILLHEICEWEEKLLKNYKEMTEKITDGMDHRKILWKGWSTNAWIRLNGNRQASEARWKDDFGQEEQELLKQSVNYAYRPKGWSWCDQWDGIDQWDSVLRQYTKEFEGSKGSSEFEDPRKMLDDFLDQSNIEDKARRYGGEWMREAVEDWCEEMNSRLNREIGEMHFRLWDGLGRCNEFEGSDEYFDLVHRSSQWIGLSRLYWGDRTRTLNRLLEMNKHRFLCIKFSDFTDNDLVKVIPGIQDMTSLTSVILRRVRSGDEAHGALLSVIHKNGNIISISGNIGLTWEIRAALQRNIHMLGNRTVFFFKPFGAQGHCMSFRKDDCFTLRFLAPAEGTLTLWIRHCSKQSDTTLLINEVESFRHQVPEQCVTEDIVLRSPTHFTLNCRTTLTFVLSGLTRFPGYNLFDIQLLDETQDPYDAALYVPHLSKSTNGIPDPIGTAPSSDESDSL